MNQKSFQKPATGQRPTRIVLTGTRSAFIGPNWVLEPFRTAVATIIIGLDTEPTLHRIENRNAENARHPVFVIPPRTLCKLQAEGDIAILFCDALRDDYSEIDYKSLARKIDPLRGLLKNGPQVTLWRRYSGN